MIKITKPVSRETSAVVHDGGKLRPIIVTIRERSIGLRLKGRHKEYDLGIEGLFTRAVAAEVGAKL